MHLLRDVYVAVCQRGFRALFCHACSVSEAAADIPNEDNLLTSNDQVPTDTKSILAARRSILCWNYVHCIIALAIHK